MPKKPWRQLTFLLGEAALALASGGVLFIIISRVAGPAVLGTYALALAWLTLFQGVSGFGIPDFIMREVGAYGRNAAGPVIHAMALGLGMGTMAVCTMLGACRLLGYPTDVVQVISIASLAVVPAFLNTACRAVFLAFREIHLSFLAALIEVAIMLPASLLLLFSGAGALALIVTLVIAKIASASISLAFLYGRVAPVRPAFDWRLLRRTAAAVGVFGIGTMLGMLSMRVNIIMASLWVDIAAVGHFAAATKIMEIGLMFPSLLGQLLMSRIAYSFNTQGDRDPNRFSAWYRVLLAFILPTFVGAWVFAGVIMETLFGPGFGTAVWTFRILMIYFLFESIEIVTSTILRAAQRAREDVGFLVFNPVTNIVLNLLLLPSLGTVGSAIGRVAGVVVSTALRNVFIARQLGAVSWFRFALKPALISIGVGWLCSALPIGHPLWLLLAYAVASAALLKLSASFSFAAIKDMMTLPS